MRNWINRIGESLGVEVLDTPIWLIGINAAAMLFAIVAVAMSASGFI